MQSARVPGICDGDRTKTNAANPIKMTVMIGRFD